MCIWRPNFMRWSCNCWVPYSGSYLDEKTKAPSSMYSRLLARSVVHFHITAWPWSLPFCFDGSSANWQCLNQLWSGSRGFWRCQWLLAWWRERGLVPCCFLAVLLHHIQCFPFLCWLMSVLMSSLDTSFWWCWPVIWALQILWFLCTWSHDWQTQRLWLGQWKVCMIQVHGIFLSWGWFRGCVVMLLGILYIRTVVVLLFVHFSGLSALMMLTTFGIISFKHIPLHHN